MSIPRTSDPKVERILPRIEKRAGVKNSEMFRVLMLDVVDRAHRMAKQGPASLKRTKKIGRLVCELQQELNDNPDLSQHLERVQHLEHVSKRLECSDSKAVSNVSNLADALSQTASALCWLERLKENRLRGEWEERARKQFVSGLLDATYLAGGDLGVNRRTERGSLVEVVELLQPHLPELFQHGLKESTLKTIKTAWVKNRKK
jgi:hypothetical protein